MKVFPQFQTLFLQGPYCCVRYKKILVIKELQVHFYYMSSRDLPKYIKNKVLITCITLYKTLVKTKKTSGTSLPVSFSS